MDSAVELTKHWDHIFQKTDDEELGWFENDFSQTLKFLSKIPRWQQSRIFVPGVGTSGLIDILIHTNAHLVLNDLSPRAIEKLKNRFPHLQHNIRWLCQDVSKKLPLESHSVDIWLDRAVLHFIRDEKDIEVYFNNISTIVRPGGYVFFAEFSKQGAKKCAGLHVRQYDIDDLNTNLASFELIASEAYIYTNPAGDERPYIYALYQKRDECM